MPTFPPTSGAPSNEGPDPDVIPDPDTAPEGQGDEPLDAGGDV